jgi:hypothetical protein
MVVVVFLYISIPLFKIHTELFAVLSNMNVFIMFQFWYAKVCPRRVGFPSTPPCCMFSRIAASLPMYCVRRFRPRLFHFRGVTHRNMGKFDVYAGRCCGTPLTVALDVT